MERRLQLLLDQERYDRVAGEAKRTGRSVAAVIRDAIDFSFPPGDDTRAAAIAEFLALADADPTPAQSWAEIKAELEERYEVDAG
jgi:hypothetical protein